MKTTLVLFVFGLVALTLAACTAQETAAATVAVTASAKAIIDAVVPLLPPETVAKLQTVAASIDGQVQATATAVGTIADAIAQIRTSAASQFAQIQTSVAESARAMHEAAIAQAALPSREEVYLASSGAAAVGTAASRGLSVLKHKKA